MQLNRKCLIFLIIGFFTLTPSFTEASKLKIHKREHSSVTQHLIIFGEGTNPDTSDRLLQTWWHWGQENSEIFQENAGLATSHLLHIEPAGGFPMKLKSEDVPSLNPGFWIVALGACIDSHEAYLYQELLSFSFPGSFVKDVHGIESGCPVLLIDGQYDHDPTIKARSNKWIFPLLRGSGYFHWHVRGLPKAKKACKPGGERLGELDLELLHGPNIVTSAHFSWDCSQEFFIDARAVWIGMRSYVLLRFENNKQTESLLFGLPAGTIGEVLRLCDFPIEVRSSESDEKKLVLETGDVFRWNERRFEFLPEENIVPEEAPWSCAIDGH